MRVCLNLDTLVYRVASKLRKIFNIFFMDGGIYKNYINSSKAKVQARTAPLL
jgi:hypothetical protein